MFHLLGIEFSWWIDAPITFYLIVALVAAVALAVGEIRLDQKVDISDWLLFPLLVGLLWGPVFVVGGALAIFFPEEDWHDQYLPLSKRQERKLRRAQAKAG